MSQWPQSTVSTILLIEADPLLRRIITLGLQNRGMEVIEAAALKTLPADVTQSVDLVVLDVDMGATRNRSLLESVQVHPHLSILPLVLLSWDAQLPVATPAAIRPGQVALRPLALESQLICLPKPFDARALHRVIDQQLASRAMQKAAHDARLEANLLAAYSARHITSSIWPVITAAGLLLVVVGFLLQFAIAILGMLIVFVAVIAWNLGQKSEPPVAALGQSYPTS